LYATAWLNNETPKKSTLAVHERKEAITVVLRSKNVVIEQNIEFSQVSM
jgi:hypothetical protein